MAHDPQTKHPVHLFILLSGLPSVLLYVCMYVCSPRKRSHYSLARTHGAPIPPHVTILTHVRAHLLRVVREPPLLHDHGVELQLLLSTLHYLESTQNQSIKTDTKKRREVDFILSAKYSNRPAGADGMRRGGE